MCSKIQLQKWFDCEITVAVTSEMVHCVDRATLITHLLSSFGMYVNYFFINAIECFVMNILLQIHHQVRVIPNPHQLSHSRLIN